ncbi:MAG TPA: PsbP-related protein [Bacteroidales bacterium]
MKHTKLFLIISLLITTMACGQTKQKSVQNDIPDSWKMLDETSYTIQYPDSFELNKSGLMGTSFLILSKQVSPQDMFRENVNLVIEDLSAQNVGLDQYVKISEGQIKTMITNANILENKRIKDGDSEFHKFVYTGTQGQYNLKFEQYFRIIKKKAYVLTLTCEVDQFDKYKEVFEKVMNSFKVK